VTQPWESAQPVDAARAARLVGGQFPELRGVPVRHVANGWDNSVLLVGDVLFRFPRREIAVTLQSRELAVLPYVADRVPLPVPVPTHLGEPAEDYPWPFWGAAMLPGVELARVPDVDRTAAAEALGAFLRALHDLPAPVDLPVDPMHRAAPRLRAERTREWLDQLRAARAFAASAEVDALVGLDLGVPHEPSVLVHGDLHLRHLLVLPDGRPSGVIDWGDTCRADPAVDLSLAYAAFSGRARDAVLASYGPIDTDRELRARSLAVGLCAGLARAAVADGDDVLLAEYLRGIARAAS
jgi:aminoglycoside phosphotransferase (APT) family kinase protein